MPSGYTADVQDGKVTEFKDYALNCARAFGALITMRDEPHDATIPEEFAPSTSYHDKAIEKATKRIAELRAMDDAQVRAEIDKDHIDAVRYYNEANERDRLTRERYEAMLVQVRAWQPPSPDHQSLHEFMEKQLVDSLVWDTHTREEPIKPTDIKAWVSNQIAEEVRSHKYHIEQRDAEIERADGRTKWVRELRESLA